MRRGSGLAAERPAPVVRPVTVQRALLWPDVLRDRQGWRVLRSVFTSAWPSRVWRTRMLTRAPADESHHGDADLAADRLVEPGLRCGACHRLVQDGCHMGIDPEIVGLFGHTVALLGHQPDRLSLEFITLVASFLCHGGTPPFPIVSPLSRCSFSLNHNGSRGSVSQDKKLGLDSN